MRYTCDVAGCGEPITENTGSRGGLPVCSKCRSVRYYWRNQGAAALKDRMSRLAFWRRRMTYLAPFISKTIKAANNRVSAARARLRGEHRPGA